MKIKGTKIGLVGDLHLGSKNGTQADQWEKVYDDLLEWIVGCFTGKVETVMFLGDIFDGRFSKTREKAMSFKTLTYADKFFKSLSENFEIIAYSGNHDVYYKDRCDVSALSLLDKKPNIRIIDKLTNFSVGNKVYKIVPWSYHPFEENEEYDNYDAIFAHMDIQTFNMNSYKVSDHGYSTKELFKNCDKVYTGHYHLRQKREYQKGKKEIMYVGTPLQLDWNEAGKESFIHILDLEANEISEEFINDFSPKHLKIKASEIIEGHTDTVGNIVEVLWDIEDEKKIKSLEGKLEISKTFDHKVNLSKKTVVNTEEIKEISSSINPTEQIEEYVNLMDLDSEFSEKIIEKSKEYLTIVL